jgi:hypothetical protein
VPPAGTRSRENGNRGAADHPPAGVPRPFIAGHRGHIVIAMYVLVVTSLIVIIAIASGSFASACVFAALLTAAASVLVLPAAMALLCAAEAAEARWLCRHHEEFRRWWTEARNALSEAPTAVVDRSGVRRDYWRTLAPHALCSEVSRLLASAGYRVEQVPIDDEAGVDIVASRGSARAVVRCWADLGRCGPAVARELLAAKDDFEADEAVIVAPGGSSPKLLEYREKRRFLIVDSDGLVAAELAGGLELFSC